MAIDSAFQPHALMSRVGNPSSHSIGKGKGRATTSAFSDYTFGPMDEGKSKQAVKPVTGMLAQQKTAAANADWISQVQSMAGKK